MIIKGPVDKMFPTVANDTNAHLQALGEIIQEIAPGIKIPVAATIDRMLRKRGFKIVRDEQ